MKRSTFFKTLLASVAAFFGLKKVEPFFKPSATKAKHVAVKFSDGGKIKINDLSYGRLYSSESGAHWPGPVMEESMGVTVKWGTQSKLIVNTFNDKGELIQYTQEDGKEMEVKNLGKGWFA